MYNIIKENNNLLTKIILLIMVIFNMKFIHILLNLYYNIF